MVLTKGSMANLRNQSGAAISRKEMGLRPTRGQSGAAKGRKEMSTKRMSLMRKQTKQLRQSVKNKLTAKVSSFGR